MTANHTKANKKHHFHLIYCFVIMSGAFEPLTVGHSLDTDDRQSERFVNLMVMNHVKRLLKYERRQPNRYNRHNRIMVVNRQNGLKSMTNELWIDSENEEEEINDYHKMDDEMVIHRQRDGSRRKRHRSLDDGADSDDERPNGSRKTRRYSHESRKIQVRRGERFMVTDLPEIKKDFTNNMNEIPTNDYMTLASGNEISPRTPVMYKQEFVKYSERQPSLCATDEVRHDKDERSRVISNLRYHTHVLGTLLHVNMLRHNWPMSYKIYCVIARLNGHNLKNDWTIALEILKHLNEKEFIQIIQEEELEQNSNDNTETELTKQSAKISDQEITFASRSKNPQMANLYHNSEMSFDYIVNAIKNPKMRTYSGKIIKMLKLMQSIFSKNAPNIISEHTYPHQVFPYKAYEPKDKINRFHRSMAPMYTTSTPSMVATYTYILLWELIISGRFLEFNSIADPLSFTGHVSNDPMFHYLFGLCKQVQAIYLYTELQHITNVIDLEVAIDKIIFRQR
ncbi:unnamed protein product [Ambrosiozyma monospora]|uniref:Unnamed protein product n=1 Tax=Ambrosiozyma monospora TaxID=43982 RepID=A0ACB5T6I2_AMBMO|nr:unnamed protein product [Ambrosiozyma monospora]